jgi:hypothetical protein
MISILGFLLSASLIRPPSSDTPQRRWQLEVLHNCGLRIQVCAGTEAEIDAEMADMANCKHRPPGTTLIKSRLDDE